jgi:Pentapeptide repeats (8 copies)
MARAIIDPVKTFYRDHTIIAAIITVSFLVVAIFAVKNGLGVANKKAWNWLDVLVVPVVLAVGAAWYQETEQERDRQRENEQQDRERREANARKELQDEIEERRAQDAALQAYLDHMSALLIDKGLREDPDEYASVRVTARARTLAVLSQLDGKRKGTVLQFLREARLINRECTPRKSRLFKGRVFYPRIIGLDGADLSKAHLRRAKLISTSGEEHVSLKEAILREANLIEANLRGADLRSANLRGAWMIGVELDDSGETKRPADLRGADLRETEGLDEERLSKAIGDRTTKLPDDIQAFNAWRKPSDERPCEE